MSTTVEMFVMHNGELFSRYAGIEDGQKLFLKKVSWAIGMDYLVIDTNLTKIAEGAVSIYQPDTHREVNFWELKASARPLSAKDPHFPELQTYIGYREKVLDALTSE